MMKNLVPVTKLIGTFAFSFLALVMHTTLPLVVLVVIELILLGLCGSLSRNLKAVFSLAVFAVFLAVVQLLGGGSLESAYVTGLRMLAMTIVFIILLTTTRLQDLTAPWSSRSRYLMNMLSCSRRPCASYPISSPKARPSRKPRPAGGCRRRAMSLRKSSII